MMSCRKEQAEVHAANTHAINLRSGPYLDEEVVSISETNLNQTYADPGKFNGEIFVAVKRIEVDKSNGVISQQALDSFEVKALDFASHHFYCDCPDPDHQVPIAYDIWIDSTNTNYLRLAVKSIVGTTNENLSWPLSFGPGAEYPAVENGLCSINSRVSYDIISKYININKVGPLAVNQYFVDIDLMNSWDFSGWKGINSNDPVPGDLIMDYNSLYVHCIEASTGPDPCHYGSEATTKHCYDQWTLDELWCLDDVELNFYLDQISQMIEDNRHGRTFINITIDEYTPKCIGDSYECWELGTPDDLAGGVTYGILKTRPIFPPFPLLLPSIECN